MQIANGLNFEREIPWKIITY